MGCFVEVERELTWAHSVGINSQYDFFYFGFMSTEDVLSVYDVMNPQSRIILMNSPLIYRCSGPMSMYCDMTTHFGGIGIYVLVHRVSKYILPTGSKDLIQGYQNAWL